VKFLRGGRTEGEGAPRRRNPPPRGVNRLLAVSYLLGAPGALFGSAGGVDGIVAGGGVNGVAGGEADGERSMLLGLSLTGAFLFESVHPAAVPARRASAQNPVNSFLIVFTPPGARAPIP
jgi:hypothetical protein